MIKVFIGFALAYALFSLYLYFYQRQFIYFPSQIFMTPQEAGIPDMQVIQLSTQDGLELRAWYRPPKNVRLPTLVHFHGNAGNIGNRASLLPPFLDEGYGVLLRPGADTAETLGAPAKQGSIWTQKQRSISSIAMASQAKASSSMATPLEQLLLFRWLQNTL
jgi:hypothetical protein